MQRLAACHVGLTQAPGLQGGDQVAIVTPNLSELVELECALSGTGRSR
jgi:hypothetical protein